LFCLRLLERGRGLDFWVGCENDLRSAVKKSSKGPASATSGGLKRMKTDRQATIVRSGRFITRKILPASVKNASSHSKRHNFLNVGYTSKLRCCFHSAEDRSKILPVQKAFPRRFQSEKPHCKGLSINKER
jgi:hypothetical protein